MACASRACLGMTNVMVTVTRGAESSLSTDQLRVGQNDFTAICLVLSKQADATPHMDLSVLVPLCRRVISGSVADRTAEQMTDARLHRRCLGPTVLLKQFAWPAPCPYEIGTYGQ